MSSKSRDTHDALLAAARELLEQQPYETLSMATVAARANVSRQALYLHFASKSQLLLALVERVDAVGGLDELIHAMRAAGSGSEMLDRFLDLVAKLTPRVYRVGIALAAAAERDPAAAAAWRDRADSRRATCSSVVRRLAAEGALAAGYSIREATDALWALTSMRVFEDLVIRRHLSQSRYRSLLGQIVRRALVDDTPPGGERARQGRTKNRE